MQAEVQTSRMFNGFSYTKTTKQIVDAMQKRIVELRQKIKDREERLVALRTTHDITDAMLVDLFRQARNAAKVGHEALAYSTVRAVGSTMKTETSIGAGVVNNLLTEGDFIEAERKDADRLELIARNLGPVVDSNGKEIDKHQLDLAEIKYLGF